MSDGIFVIQKETKNSFKPIIKNCKSILLDSVNNVIYIKSIAYTKELKYNSIIFEDKSDLGSFEVVDITKGDFLLYVKDCKQCRQFDFTND